MLRQEFEDYHGHRLYRFPFGGTEAIVVEPANPRPDKAWLWKGCYFNAFPKFEIAMLERGFSLVHVVPKTMFPAPDTMRIWDDFYAYLTQELAFPAKAILFGLSRGGFYIYTWARQNPDKVACIYGDNPMCDFKSTYKGTGQAAGMPDKWERLIQEFGFASEQEALDSPWAGPIDDLKPLAEAGVPIIHVAATEDQIVPYEENTVIVAKRYQDLGGRIKVISHPGLHHPHGLEDPTPVIEFIMASALGR
jgi:pimeloyl-ACP methyl ester carboxylesterase